MQHVVTELYEAGRQTMSRLEEQMKSNDLVFDNIIERLAQIRNDLVLIANKSKRRPKSQQVKSIQQRE